MTTFAELKTRAARSLRDPSKVTFLDAELGDYINRGIAEVGRYAPQQFVEDIQLNEGQNTYQLRGGTGNLIANPSFEQGDETMFDSAYNVLTPSTAPDLTAGWQTTYSDIRVLFGKSAYAKSGTVVGIIYVPANTSQRSMYQDIPVNPGTTYYLSGWHWKGAAGGEGNVILVNTLDVNSAVILTDVIRHDTTAGTPQFMSGSYTTPVDGTVKYLQVKIVGYSAGAYSSEQSYGFEDIKLVESADANLVASNSRANIEVRRVEIFNSSYTPVLSVLNLTPNSSEYISSSEAGWDYWAGDLTIPVGTFNQLDTAINFLRVWGWAPYDRLTDDTQVTDLTNELEEAVLLFVRIEGLSALVMDRDLFTQWQTRSGNTDASPASIMNAQSLAQEEWRRRVRSLQVLRGS